MLFPQCNSCLTTSREVVCYYIFRTNVLLYIRVFDGLSLRLVLSCELPDAHVGEVCC